MFIINKTNNLSFQLGFMYACNINITLLLRILYLPAHGKYPKYSHKEFQLREIVKFYFPLPSFFPTQTALSRS